MEVKEMVEKLRYKTNNIKAKIEPEFFNECANVLEKCEELIERDTPKKPNLIYYPNSASKFSEYHCPSCEICLPAISEEIYCWNCGQCINWDDLYS